MSLCECGCGQPTVVSPNTDRSHGWVRGEPRRFLQGHNNRLLRTGYDTEDRGYDTPCWIWRGSVNERGYGQSWYGVAHRVLYEQHIGRVPEGLELDHLCRQRRCVNPDHLEPVTHRENVRRGALARARENVDADPTGIRALRLALGLTQGELAERLGVSAALVSLWERGKHRVTAEHEAALRALSPELAEVA